MNGNRYTFDTNAVIALLKGNSQLLNITMKAEWIAISVISYIEFHSFPDLSEEDKSLFEDFANRVEIVDLSINNKDLIEKIISFRHQYKIKLPDSIVASTAFCNNSNLVTADKEFSKIKDIMVTSF